MRDKAIFQRSNEEARKAKNEEQKKNERSKRGMKLLLERNFQKFFELINGSILFQFTSLKIYIIILSN